MVELDLTGPCTGISAYGGCFEIQIHIPRHLGGPIKWEWDCEDERYAGQVDALEPSHHTINIQDGVALAEVTYTVMSNAREATVKVKLRRFKDGQSPRVVSGEIKALIDGFKDKSILLRGKGTVHPTSLNDDPWCHIELARNVVAVPCGKVLHIEVDLKIEAGGVKDKIVKVPDLKFDNGICSSKTDDGREVEVEVTWYPEVKISGHQPDVLLVNTIGEEGSSFTGFIEDLRGCLTKHRDRREIMGCRVLAKQCPEQPARWLHVKLQAVVGEETSWTTLIMRDDDLYVHGFMNKQGVCYELLENKDGSVNMLPENEYNNPQPLLWGLKYRTILDVKDDSEAAAKLISEGLGQSFAIKAVRRLSSSIHPDDDQVVGIMMSARLALAGLIIMVCESARFNPVLEALADGWSNGTRFTKELMDRYVQKHEEISWELQAWKSRGFRRPPEIISELQDTYLVLDARIPKVSTEDDLSYAGWHGKTRFELLSVRADLEVIGTKIIIFDGKRGQIIYRHEERQKEPGMMVLALTGPHTRISAADGCFAIKIDIPGATPIKWEPDPEYAIKIGEPVTQTIGNIAEVTYAVMHDALEATVQVKLRLKNGHSPSGISGEISTLIEGFQDKDRPNILFRRANKGTADQCTSSTDDSMFLLQLARNVVLVPREKVLLIKVDLGIENSNNQGVKPLNFKADLRIENGILSQYHVVDGCEVEVNFAWNPKADIGEIKRRYDPESVQDSTLEEIRDRRMSKEKIGPPHLREVVYTIGDDKISYARFIEALRRILTDYQNRDRDGILLLNQQEMWLHVKLQVAGEEETSTTTLFIQYGSLYVQGFMNQSAVWCLDDFIPSEKGWHVSESMANIPIIKYEEKAPVGQRKEIVDRVNRQLGSATLGKISAEEAVRVLSAAAFEQSTYVQDGDAIWEALAKLKVMVCDSAKINPVHDAIIEDWNKEKMTLAEEHTDYIKNWEPISSALLQWKYNGRWEGYKYLKWIGIESPHDAQKVIHLCCPLTRERINELKGLEKATKYNQTVQSVFGSPTRDYLISNKGDKVPISDLEGKYVGVCSVENDFTAVLAKIYDKLKEVGEKFEVVAVPSDNTESSFDESFAKMPWLAIPPGDQMCQKLGRYFELRSPLPTLVLIGPDGKTLHNNIAYVIQDHGFEAWVGFPFTYEKLEILGQKKAMAEAAWQSYLRRGDLNYVIGNGGATVPVSDLVGKTVLLYFGAEWCWKSEDFLPFLIDKYKKIKDKNSDFEVVFISNDTDESSFNNYFFQMPWLALPWKDERTESLREAVGVETIPSLVAIGPTGKIVSKDAKDLLMFYGADAFPFTEERIEELMRSISSS